LDCSNNYLTGINLKNNTKLKILNLSNNNFSKQDLGFISHLISLEEIDLGNTDIQKIKENKYNRFFGSLKHLKKLNNLKKLVINNTDVDSGLEYLSGSLEEIYYSVQSRTDAKVELEKEISELKIFKENYFKL
jgi:Leucine-rich repeat (LRR) protein